MKLTPLLLSQVLGKINDPDASDRGIQRHNTTFTPSPYPSPQGEGTSGNPAASGRGIEKHNEEFILHRRSGARGLRAILENCLVDIMYELPSMQNIQ